VAIELRIARADDADAVAAIYLLSRKQLMAYAPLAHSDEEIRRWVARELVPSGNVIVAVEECGVVGFAALSRRDEYSWLDQLYIAPDRIGQRIGSQLLNRVLQELPRPVRLYAFQANERARRFYENRGFHAIAFGDGSGNEEKCPDVLYELT